MQGSFNGKPKAIVPRSFDETVAFGLPLNELVCPLLCQHVLLDFKSLRSQDSIFKFAWKGPSYSNRK